MWIDAEDSQELCSGWAVPAGLKFDLTRIYISHIIVSIRNHKDDDGDGIFILKVTESRVC